jgi:hypothetical protein
MKGGKNRRLMGLLGNDCSSLQAGAALRRKARVFTVVTVVGDIGAGARTVTRAVVIASATVAHGGCGRVAVQGPRQHPARARTQASSRRRLRDRALLLRDSIRVTSASRSLPPAKRYKDAGHHGMKATSDTRAGMNNVTKRRSQNLWLLIAFAWSLRLVAASAASSSFFLAYWCTRAVKIGLRYLRQMQVKKNCRLSRILHSAYS